MNKSEKTTYRVHAFWGHGQESVPKKKAKIMMAVGIRGAMKGVTTPFGMNIDRHLGLKVGDTFTETIVYEKVGKATP